MTKFDCIQTNNRSFSLKGTNRCEFQIIASRVLCNTEAELIYFTTIRSKWELGKGYPDIDNFIKLSDLYEVSLDKLITG